MNWHFLKAQIALEFMMIFIVLLLISATFYHFFVDVRDYNRNNKDYEQMYNIVEPINYAILEAHLNNKITILTLPDHNCRLSHNNDILKCKEHDKEYSVTLPIQNVKLDNINPGDTILIVYEKGNILVKKVNDKVDV